MSVRKRCIKFNNGKGNTCSYRSNIKYRKGLKNYIEILFNENNEETDGKCVCGCKCVSKVLSVYLRRYFREKVKWFKKFNVDRRSVNDYEEINLMILKNGCTAHTIKELDLDLIYSDLSRQQWITNDGIFKLAKDALYSFCIRNNVGYWQGLHDIASAFIYLSPTPSVGELAALVERFLRNYAPILFGNNNDDVLNKARDISNRWKLYFKYFFPKCCYDTDAITDFNSWNISWFITLGFYRFQCVYNLLGFIYIMAFSRYNNLINFIYNELGYLTTKGCISYLINNDCNYNHITNCNILGNCPDSIIINSIVSEHIYINPEELINTSKYFYDQDCELATFPLVYLSRCIVILHELSANCYTNSNNFLNLSINTIFGDNSVVKDYTITNNRSGNHNTTVLIKNRKCALSENVSETLIKCMLYNYIDSVEYNLNLYKRGMCTESPISDSRRYSLKCNIIDLRSDYMLSGIEINDLFPNANVIRGEKILNYINSKNDKFYLWILLTDDGRVSDDSSIIDVLNRSLIPGICILEGGYKLLLQSLHLPIPKSADTNGDSIFKRLLGWGPITPRKIKDDNDFGLNTQGYLNKDVHANHLTRPLQFSDSLPSSNNFDRGNCPFVCTDIFMPKNDRILTNHSTKRKMFVLQCKLGSTEVMIKSNGAIKIDGLVLHPYNYNDVDYNVKFILTVVALFGVNYIDGIWDVLPYKIYNVDTKFCYKILKNSSDLLEKFIITTTTNKTNYNLNIRIIGTNNNTLYTITKSWYIGITHKSKLLKKILYAQWNCYHYLCKLIRYFVNNNEKAAPEDDHVAKGIKTVKEDVPKINQVFIKNVFSRRRNDTNKTLEPKHNIHSIKHAKETNSNKNLIVRGSELTIRDNGKICSVISRSNSNIFVPRNAKLKRIRDKSFLNP